MPPVAAPVLLVAGAVGRPPFELRARPIKLDAGGSAGVWPRWIQVAEEGVYLGHPSGPFAFNAAIFAQIVANFRRLPEYRQGAQPVAGMPGVVAFDWRHASEKSPTDGGASAMSAQAAIGWAWELEVRPLDSGALGLFAFADMIPEARSLIDAGRIAWTSVCVWPDVTDQVSAEKIGAYLSSIALTNDPFIRGMIPLQIAAEADRNDKETTMDLNQLLAFIAARLGCAPTPEAVTSALPLTLEKAAAETKDAKGKLGALLSAFGVSDPDKAIDEVGAMRSRVKAAEDAWPSMAEMYEGKAEAEDASAEKDVQAVAATALRGLPEDTAKDAMRGFLMARTGGIELARLRGADGTLDVKPLVDPARRTALFDALRARETAKKRFRERHQSTLGAAATLPKAGPPAHQSALFQRWFAETDQQGPGTSGGPMRGAQSPAHLFAGTGRGAVTESDANAVTVDLSDEGPYAALPNPGMRAMEFVRQHHALFGLTAKDAQDHDAVHQAGTALATQWRQAQGDSQQPAARF